MFDETRHILYGKDTSCHKCSGVAVWVFNGDMVGNYHYCRACKTETGPFAKSITPPPPPSTKPDNFWSIDVPVTFLIRRKGYSALQLDTQMEMQDRILFDFMKPPGETL